VGRATGLYPDDPLAALRVDELMDATEDLMPKIMKAGVGTEGEAKEAARRESSEEGEVFAHLQRINTHVGKFGQGGFAVGDSLTIADLHLFTTASNLISGLYDGVRPTCLDAHAHIQAVRRNVRGLPKVDEWYKACIVKELRVPDSYK